MENMLTDDQSISDFLVCLGPDEEDDSASSVAMVSMEEDASIVELTNPPTQQRNCQPQTIEKKALLNELMKRYPNHIPDRIRLSRQTGSKPVCLFINYMGTRRAPPTSIPTHRKRQKSTACIDPSSHPTLAPNHPSRANQHGWKNLTSKNPAKTVTVSPKPTLSPSHRSSDNERVLEF